MQQEFVIVLITISIQVINCVVDVLRYNKDSKRIAKHDRKKWKMFFRKTKSRDGRPWIKLYLKKHGVNQVQKKSLIYEVG